MLRSITSASAAATFSFDSSYIARSLASSSLVLFLAWLMLRKPRRMPRLL